MLIDTSGWLCLHHRDELQHLDAVKLFNESHTQITTNYVLAEFVPLASVRGLPRETALDFTRGIMLDPTVEIVWVDEILHSKAVELLTERNDKGYSLCDAVSFIVMRERGLTDALTTDRHFSQEGFVKLL